MKSQDLDKYVFKYSIDANTLEEENKLLKITVEQLKSEIDKIRESPLMVCEVRERINDKAIIKIPNGNEFYVNILEGAKEIKAGETVLVEQKNLTIIRKLSTQKNFDVEKYVIIGKPNVGWGDIGGLDNQVEEIQEVVELPLKKPELFKKIGITPPKGILLYGPPGTGKTLLAKAVASSTKSTFIEIVGSELVQKFIGEGAKLVKEVFQLAREKAPSIIFIDEIDALAAKRIEIGTSGEREVQRTFMQFLAELDGFKPLDNVKIIGCTNRKDILDPAVIRPGRLDRLIHVPVCDEKGRLEIFKVHTKDMSLDKGVRPESINKKMEEFSGAEIKAVCTEAGYFAIRANRSKVCKDDFLKAVEKVKKEEELEGKDYMGMFG
jgi:proteasome regulatory subunit